MRNITLTVGQPVLRPGRRRQVLHELDEGAIVSFQGLRRRLGLHPEALRRTLRRLEEEGLIEAESGGYRATEAGQQAAGARPRAPVQTLLQAVLPPAADAEVLAAALAGRWFGDLRWFGRSDGPDETSLFWITPDGRLVRLRLRAGTLTIEAEGALGQGAPFGPLLAALGSRL